MKYFKNILLNIDATFGSIIFGAPAGITISAWVGYKHPGSWVESVINTIMGSSTHCRDSIDYNIMKEYYK